jgi:hypothetical protein
VSLAGVAVDSLLLSALEVELALLLLPPLLLLPLLPTVSDDVPRLSVL